MRSAVQAGYQSFILSSILYLCGLFLFLEWMYPVSELTDTGSVMVFAVFAVYSFLITLLQVKWWVSLPMKAAGTMLLMQLLYFQGPVLNLAWLGELSRDVLINLDLMLSQQWYALTPMFRTLLFFMLIWLMSYLLYYWFVVMKRVFLFVLLTLVYITVLDTFTGYQAEFSIIRSFVLSFIALGLAHFMRELNNGSVKISRQGNALVWLLPLIAIVLFGSVVGFVAPKPAPQWPDPVPFIQSAAEGAGSDDSGSVVRKVGYGEDDSRLGGSFIQDYAPVFRVEAEEDQYWRIETKDVYTGKGWESSGERNYQLQANGDISLDTFSKNVETEEATAVLVFQESADIDKLVYPYGIEQVDHPEAQFLLDDGTEAVQTKKEGEVVNLDGYTLTYEDPSFEINKLREAGTEDPEEIVERYTQLPKDMPERVRELAREVTKPFETRYDQAKAVENHFTEANGFTYQTSNVPVPGEEQDYVDQFLFDSKAGYCDNYSTSMVVLLRSLDIPARWVKGFTGGEMLGSQNSSLSDEHQVYEVTNSNAHSWVEVYFPEVGWVPFEPTQGFSNPIDLYTDWGEIDAQENQEDRQNPEDEQEVEEPELEEEEAATVMAESDVDKGSGSSWGWQWPVAAAAVGLLAFLLYRSRFRWQTYLLELRFRHRGGAEAYQHAYLHVMKILEAKGWRRKPDQTLREYANMIDRRYGTGEMGRLTAQYERMLYKGETDQTHLKELRQLWKNLIKRILG
ncbi:DUF3488 and DUF4129 domain-containing transglutaminase family protein [Virgibacillus xinjiangensis]|uniref:DUF3488 and DUF4129 domain-containing transglutaminase family protein n=1 Tax=Virgibacillus xinjiangensis TaxID=393090 RepID=A0ABV7CSS8_9BACI